MAITYTWTINAINCYPMAEGQTDVVSVIHWTLNGTDGTHNASVYGTVNLAPYKAGGPFIPFANLTKDHVIKWVVEALGAEQVASFEENLSAQIEALINPTIVSPPLPW
jgi:hypothetical protein